MFILTFICSVKNKVLIDQVVLTHALSTEEQSSQPEIHQLFPNLGSGKILITT